jgi:hypothetical protein
MKRTLAATHLLLISPAVLFLVAVILQRLQPLQKELALTAQHIVMWYAQRTWTLWILLLALPLSVLISGVSRCCGIRAAGLKWPAYRRKRLPRFTLWGRGHPSL